ncbi:unnamed protein product [Effrenium voratum]|uniref:EF-hand domain-containing protein n=1 Tax=Effrenium voratum TaxID=2562239 RepID=A0AA36MW35_9DINO|nr:unnamed protein product [Effrenium voratum]
MPRPCKMSRPCRPDEGVPYDLEEELEETARSFEEHVKGLVLTFQHLQTSYAELLSQGSELQLYPPLAVSPARSSVRRMDDTKSPSMKSRPTSKAEALTGFSARGSPQLPKALELELESKMDERAYKAQFHRLDKAANGRLEQEDLLAVMQTFSHGWELENVEDLLKQVNQLTGGHTSPGGHGHSRSNLRTPHESIDLDGFVALMSSEELISGKDMKSSTKRDTKFLREALQAENNHNLYKDDGHWVQGGKHQHKGPHGKLAILVDVIPGIVIVLNALVLGLSSDIAEDHIVWQVCNTFFLVFYTLEFLVKIGVFGWRWFFLGNEWPWNAFDVFCLVLSYLEELVTWILRSTEGQVADLNTIVFIRMLRLTRLVRLVRTLRFEIFYELKTMVLGVASGMRVLFWAMVLLLVIIYTTGVAAKNVFGEAEPEFETVPAAMFTLFRCFTDGCTAYDGTPLMERLRPKYGILFVISYVFMFMLVCLGVFNLIMAIFLENVMVNQLQRKLMGIDHSANRIEVNLKEDLLRLLLRSKSNGVPEARSCGGLGGRCSHMT